MIYVAVPLREGAQPAGYIRLARPLKEMALAIGGDGANRFGNPSDSLVSVSWSRSCFPDDARPIGRLAAFAREARTGTVSGGCASTPGTK